MFISIKDFYVFSDLIIIISKKDSHLRIKFLEIMTEGILGILFKYRAVLELELDSVKEDQTLKICSLSHNHQPEAASLNYLLPALLLIWPK